MKIKSALIIDDEVDICLLIKNFFIKKHTRVSFSTTLKEGLSKFKEINPDLLILDHNLPDGHGIENLSNFKKENNSLFIIVISAMSNLKNKALENGADFFMEKPISFIKLNDLIENGN
ncbi:MAG TPA: response regulator [Bacteroidia bacterium]|nr:response regulator [Bacteroidia bacterium]